MEHLSLFGRIRLCWVRRAASSLLRYAKEVHESTDVEEAALMFASVFHELKRLGKTYPKAVDGIREIQLQFVWDMARANPAIAQLNGFRIKSLHEALQEPDFHTSIRRFLNLMSMDLRVSLMDFTVCAHPTNSKRLDLVMAIDCDLLGEDRANAASTVERALAKKLHMQLIDCDTVHVQVNTWVRPRHAAH